MTVHAHPDDEATSTGGILHKYSCEGIQTVLVTCTGGEFGDGLGGLKPDEPGHDPLAVRRTRRVELEAACRELEISHLEMLGYHDSGMAEWGKSGTAGSFAGSDLREEVERLAALIEQYRPHVVVTYGADGGYGHPDHVRTHHVATQAVQTTGLPKKLYHTVFPKSLARRVLAQMESSGIDPSVLGQLDFDPDNPPFGVADELVTTVVDVTSDVAAKLAAIRAHASQMDNAFFANLPEQVAPMILGQEHYVRAIDRTGAPIPEEDLFSGLR
jgi:LmbE family N-acetylglucosaminyl deacetylase